MTTLSHVQPRLYHISEMNLDKSVNPIEPYSIPVVAKAQPKEPKLADSDQTVILPEDWCIETSQWMVTLTCDCGFSPGNIDDWVDLFQTFEYCIMASEKHKSDGIHVHLVFARQVLQPSKITKYLRLRYTKFNIPYVHHVSVDVKRCLTPIGAIGYVLKETSSNSDLLVCKGYPSNYLDHCRDVNVIRHQIKTKSKNSHEMNRSSAPGIILEYIVRNKFKVKSLHDLHPIYGKMMEEGYRLDSVWSSLKGITVFVCRRLGVYDAASDDSLWRAMGCQPGINC